jgi:hypothetical protein
MAIQQRSLIWKEGLPSAYQSWTHLSEQAFATQQELQG